MKLNKISLAFIGCVLVCLFASTARADPVTVRFDELPDGTPVKRKALGGVPISS